MGLPAAGLAVGEHAHIVAVEGVLHHVLAQVREDLALGDKVRVPGVVGPVGMVECKAVRLSYREKRTKKAIILKSERWELTRKNDTSMQWDADSGFGSKDFFLRSGA